MTMTDQRQKVVRASQMSDEHMRLHLISRHGMEIGDHNITFDVMQPYRALHNRQHRMLPNLTHEHGPDTREDELEFALQCMKENRLRGWRQIAGAKGVVAFHDDGSYAIRINDHVRYYNQIDKVVDILLKGKFPRGSAKRT